MPDEIKRIDYYYASVPDKPGEGARILAALRDAGVNLIAVSAFPHGARRSQLDLIPEDSATFATAAKAVGLKLSRRKNGFLIQGEDRPGRGSRRRKETGRQKHQRHLGAALLHRLRPLRRDALGQSAESAQGRKSTGDRVTYDAEDRMGFEVFSFGTIRGASSDLEQLGR
jgi:hypothetical protein